MTINGDTVPETTEGKKSIIEYLENGPDLSNFEYKSWNEETRERVNNLLSQYGSPGQSVQRVSKPNVQAEQPAPKKTEPVKVQPTVETSNESSSSESSGDLDDFINGLDL